MFNMFGQQGPHMFRQTAACVWLNRVPQKRGPISPKMSNSSAAFDVWPMGAFLACIATFKCSLGAA